MNELDIIDQIVNSTSKTTAIVCGIVFLVHHSINKISEYKKERSKTKPIEIITQELKELSEMMVKTNVLISSCVNKSIDKSKDVAKEIITLGFAKLEGELFDFCRSVILNNNIHDNEVLIKDNIINKVNAEYYSLVSSLSLLEINDKQINSYIKSEWKSQMTTDITNIIYSNGDEESRITSTRNKIKLLSKNYKMYITNNAFK